VPSSKFVAEDRGNWFLRNSGTPPPNHTAVTATLLTFVLISYRSGDYKDELVWGAVWLYRATSDNSYLTTAEQLYNEFGLQNWNGGFTWDSKISGVEVR
jgi:hypothetical protein